MSSQPDTFAGMKKRWRDCAEWMTPETPPSYQSGRIGQLKLCADELEALERHYVHKDKLRELRDYILRNKQSYPDAAIVGWIGDRLTALLGEEGQ